MVDADEIARRLRAARERTGLTQEQAADAIGVPRTAIVKIENGERAVDSLELVKLSKLYARDINDLLADTFKEDTVEVLFRSNPQLAQPQLSEAVRRCINLCRELSSLEELLGIRETRALKISYNIPAPKNTWEAVQQGREIAAAERSRLELGDSPAWELVEILRGQGIRTAEYPLPAEISGMSFVGQDDKPIIIINRTERMIERRLFSYAHEYGHRLMDPRKVIVTDEANKKSPIETRANVFAAHLLLPPRGVKNFVQKMGREKPSDIQLPDAVILAHYFGVSVPAAINQLENIDLISKAQHDEFIAARDMVRAIQRLLGKPKLNDEDHWGLFDQLIVLSLEAYKKGEITKKKVLELAREAKPEDPEGAVKDVEAVLGPP